MRGKVCEIKAAQPKESSNYNGGGGTNRGRRGSGGGNKGYRSYQQQVYPTNELYHHYGYPPANGDAAVNQGVPSTLPGQPVMYSPYGMGAYYPPAGMHGGAAYNPYMGGYSQEAAAAAAYYDHQGGMDAYGHMQSVMTATPPGPRAQAAYGNGFVPVGGDNPEASDTPAVTRQVEDESPQGTPAGGEEANQT